jgi:putative membrane protein
LIRVLELRVLPAACLAVYRVFSLALHTGSWRLLIPPGARPRFRRLLRLRWIGEAINSLLPMAQVGGDLARARLLAASANVGRPVAGAVMLADLTIGMMTQGVFAVVGLAALAASRTVPHAGQSVAAALAAAVGAGAMLVMLLRGRTLRLFLSGERGPRWLVEGQRGARWRARWQALAGGAAALDEALAEIARRPGDVALAAAWHLAGWMSHAGETWLGLRLIGAPVSWTAAVAIEALSSTARAAAFFVPGGLGVQEGTLVYLCRSVGVPMHAALVLAVLKRAREIVVGALGLASWAAAERVSLGRLISRLRAGPRRSYVDDA